jgi:hypothetical protein
MRISAPHFLDKLLVWLGLHAIILRDVYCAGGRDLAGGGAGSGI